MRCTKNSKIFFKNEEVPQLSLKRNLEPTIGISDFQYMEETTKRETSDCVTRICIAYLLTARIAQ
jgi:hypothetical protein